LSGFVVLPEKRPDRGKYRQLAPVGKDFKVASLDRRRGYVEDMLFRESGEFYKRLYFIVE
jgi:hypothetical protein